MKKLSQIIMVTAIVLSPFALSGSANAEDSCTISGTGEGSNNSCTIEKEYTCTVDSENNITVKNDNDQVAGTGKATVDGNTNGESATSGSATNENGTMFDITIDNEGGCAVASVTPGQGSVTPTAPVTPTVRPVGGSGAVVAPVAAPQVAAPAMLPDTSADSTIGLTAGLVTLLGVVILGARTAVSAYNRMNA